MIIYKRIVTLSTLLIEMNVQYKLLYKQKNTHYLLSTEHMNSNKN